MIVSRCDACGQGYTADTIAEAFAWRNDHGQKCPADEGGPNGD